MPGREVKVLGAIVGLALLCGLTLAHGLQWLWNELSWEDPRLLHIHELSLTNLLGYGLALLLAWGVSYNARSRTLANEIVDELTKVSWPSREETSHATLVVIVTVVACSLYLGIFDAFWLWLTDRILGVHAARSG